MPRVLLIPSSDYLGHPFPQRHNHIFERLHGMDGFRVHVVRFGIFGGRRLSSDCVIHDIPFELGVRKTAQYYLANAPLYLSEINRIVTEESIDAVVAGNLLPPLLHLASRAPRGGRLPFVFDLQDYYPASAAGYMAAGGSIPGIVSRGLFEAITRRLVRSASVVTAPGAALLGYARGAGARAAVLVPNGISRQFETVHRGDGVRAALGIAAGDFVCGYVGSIEFWLDMEPVVRGVALARERGVPARLLLVGGGLQTPYAKTVGAWLREYGLEESTKWAGWVPHSMVPDYVASVDLGLLPFDVGNPTAYYAAPNKLLEYLSQGRGVLATPIPEAAAYRGLVRLVRSAEEYAGAIEGAYEAVRSGADGGGPDELAVRSLIEGRSWDDSAKAMAGIISRLVGERA